MTSGVIYIIPFQKAGDRRPKGRAQHACAAQDSFRLLVSGRHVVPVLWRAFATRAALDRG